MYNFYHEILILRILEPANVYTYLDFLQVLFI